MRKLLTVLFCAAVYAQTPQTTAVSPSVSATPTFTANSGNTVFSYVLAQNVTTSTFSSAAPGTYIFHVCQPASGGTYNYTFAAFSGSVGMAVVPTGVGACLHQAASWDGSTLKFLPPTLHAATHASGGADPVTPAAIGAMPAVSGTGALAVASGTPQLVPGTSSNCVHVDGTSAACGGAGGLGDPGANGIVKRTALNTTAVATAGDIVSAQAPAFATVAISSAVVTPADVWVMNEGSGNTFSDTSGTANTVTAGGTITWSSGSGPGKCATGCAHFAGTFDSPSANHTNFNPGSTQAFSVAFWASFDALGTVEIAVSQLSTGTGNPGWYIYKNDGTPGNSTNSIIFYQQDTSGGFLSVAFGNPLTAGALHHFALTNDGSHTAAGIRMWMDGNLLGVATVIHNNLTGAATPNANVYLGSWGGGTDRFAGYLAGVHIYNRVLTQAEILPLYYAGPITDSFTQATRTTRTVLASSFATLDADCGTGAKLGGGTATDNTANLNAVLLTASATNPLELVLDGCSVTTGLFMAQAGYTAIRGTGWDSGLFVLSGSNASAISNSWGTYPNFALPARGKNIEIKNLRLNGNGGTFPTGNSTIGDVRGLPWIMTLNIENIDGVIIDDLWVYDSPSYAVLLGSVGKVFISNSRIEAPNLGLNSDGVHFDGPANDLHVANCYIQGADDLVALNAPEGLGGDITDVEITGIRAAGAGSSSIVRIYTALNDVDGNLHRGTVKNVTLNNVTGTAGIHGLVIFGNGGPQTAADWIQNIFISNVRLAAPFWFIHEAENTGDVKVVNSSWIPTDVHPAVYFDAAGGTFNNYSFHNFSIYRNPDGNQVGWLATIPNGVTLNRLELDGVSILNSIGSSYSGAPYLIDVPTGGTLGRLWVTAADPLNVTTMFSGAGETNITHVQGPGCAFFTGCTIK